ncbi:MAG: helix-turn-helix transcriptional regulator [Clostridia bacterium]
MENLGNRIKELRKAKGLTIRELAKEIGVNKSAIAFWESNTNEPKATYICRLAKFLDVSADYLLGIIEY